MKKRKKVIILTLIMMISISGIGYTSSVNGIFEGFPIINIFINGKKVEGDVPAINFKGRTMVPIRLVSEELGAKVDWDNNTSSAIISSGSLNQSNDIEELKLYSKIANHYKDLEGQGSAIRETNDSIINSVISSNYQNYIEGLNESIVYFQDMKPNFNILVTKTEKIILEASNYGIDISNMIEILNLHSKAIDEQSIMYNSLIDFNKNTNKNSSTLSPMYYNLEYAYDLIEQSVNIARPEYYYYYNKIQSY